MKWIKIVKKSAENIVVRMLSPSLVLGVAWAVCFVLLLYLWINVYVDQSSKDYRVDLKTAPLVDAVIVLGTAAYNGVPSSRLEARLEQGYALYMAGKARKILVSGDHKEQHYDEVNTMKDYLLAKGVPREDIFMDHAGLDTYDSLYRAKNIFNINKIIIATQEFHVGRAIYIARCLGLEAYGYPADNRDYFDLDYMLGRESLANIKAVFESQVWRRSAQYMGEKISIWGNGIVTEG